MDGGRRHAAALVGEAGGEMPSAPRPVGPPAQLSSRVVALGAHLRLVRLRSRNRVEHARRHPRAAPSRDAYEIVPLPSQEGRWAWRPRDLAACEKFFPFSSWRWGGGRSLGTPTRGWPAHGLPAPSGPFHLRPVEQRSVSGRDACPVQSVHPDMHRLYTRSFCLAVRPGTVQRGMYTSEGLFCLQKKKKRKKIKTCSCQATPLPP